MAAHAPSVSLSSWSWPAVVGVSSAVAGVVVQAFQRRPLGDEPLVMLAVGGVLALVAGLACPPPAWRLGIAAMLAFPVLAVVDMARGGDHNLFPIEFAAYAVYAGLSVVVAGFGRRLAGWLGRG